MNEIDKRQLLAKELTTLYDKYFKGEAPILINEIIKTCIELYYKELIQVIQGQGHFSADAKIIALEVFTDFWKKINQKHKKIENLRYYILRIGRNKAINAKKRKKKFVNIAAVQIKEFPNVLPRKNLKEMVEFLAVLLDFSDLKKAILYHKMDGDSHKEISKKLSKTENYSSQLYSDTLEEIAQDFVRDAFKAWLNKD